MPKNIIILQRRSVSALFGAVNSIKPFLFTLSGGVENVFFLLIKKWISIK
jgi:hypothetical protein